jgi:hypothetical protein
MFSLGVPVSARRAPARRLALAAAIRAAGIGGIVLALGGAAVPTVGAATATGAAWAVQATPNPLARQGLLTAVSCPSATGCVAVGSRRDRTGAGVTLAESWNGTTWSVLKTPNPPGSHNSALTGVSCTSATFCIAVGYSNSSAGIAPLDEVWNGTAWKIQQTIALAHGGQLNGVSCTSATACVAVGYSFTTGGRLALAEVWNGTAWGIRTTAPGPTTSDFTAVSCVAASACTAVGDRHSNNGTFTLAESWNGSSWSVQATPTAAGTLNGVSCASASFCLAVGLLNGRHKAIADAWDGTAWSAAQVAPAPNNSIDNLTGVSCTSATGCIAVGNYGTANTLPMAEQWHGSGTAMTLQQVPAPQSNLAISLGGVSCPSVSACTAAGDDGAALAEAWNGTSWSVQQISTPPGNASPALSAVSCASASACLAVGSYRSTQQLDVPFAEVWNGTSWSLRKVPPSPQGGDVLTGVSCFAPSACVAVGYRNSTTAPSTLAETWNGTSWSIQQTPDQPGAVESVLSGVSCTSATACTAVGWYLPPGGSFTPRFSLAEAWNGTSWSIQPTPLQHSKADHTLDGVSCTSATACTAVGHVGYQTLAEAWNGTSWSNQPTPHPEHGPDLLLGVSCTSASACIAVGSAYDGTIGEVWDGTSWSIVPTPGPHTVVPLPSGSVSCTSASACTAVWASNYRTVAAGWNGTSWSPQGTASPAGSTLHTLPSVSCVPAGLCVAVGSYLTDTGMFTLAEARS